MICKMCSAEADNRAELGHHYIDEVIENSLRDEKAYGHYCGHKCCQGCDCQCRVFREGSRDDDSR